ncbi:MAG: long-chain-fatty-acid--CoA ligase [Xanthobacteraceae bacterium]|nr:MAG: long-chain-fatty-acid--CoA ligase [Xanthobacteraceae bacterium]
MDRIWLAHYPPGVPAEIDSARYASLVDLFEESFATHGDNRAFVFMDRFMTYREIDAASQAFAAFLQSRKLSRGARVAVMMPNVLQYPIALIGILRAGCTLVNINPLYTPHELEFQLKDSGAEALVVLENFAATAQAAIGATAVRHVIVTGLGDMLGAVKGTIVNLAVRHIKKMVPAYSLPQAIAFKDALAQGRALPFNRPAVGANDTACLQYTGGTTGVAKGATLLHRNLVANTLQVEAWLQPAAAHGPKVDHMTMITALPLYHIFALTACFMLSMRIGGLNVLIPNPRDLPHLIAELVKYRPNLFPAVNTLFNALLNHADFGKIDWSGLKSAVGGGMAVQKAVAEKWYKATGCPIIEGYGLSETSPVLTCNRADSTKWTGTIGVPLPSTEISIRDDSGNEVAFGEPGEICGRGPQVMAGYWNRPDETAKVMTQDGFLRTGDIGVMNAQGETRIVDRKKDMILVSGFNVYPNEVEDVIASHPGVLECAVVGVPDEHSGEVVKAYVVRRDPSLTEEALRAFCATELTGYKIPKHIEFRAELPKTNVGKILRRALRDELVKRAA